MLFYLGSPCRYGLYNEIRSNKNSFSIGGVSSERPPSGCQDMQFVWALLFPSKHFGLDYVVKASSLWEMHGEQFASLQYVMLLPSLPIRYNSICIQKSCGEV